MATVDPKAKRRAPTAPPAARTEVPEVSLTKAAPPELTVTRLTIGGEELVVLSYPARADDAAGQLTAAEREIVRALLSGKSNAEIARERGSAERTVANQVASAYRKLAVRSRAELAARCALVTRGEL